MVFSRISTLTFYPMGVEKNTLNACETYITYIKLEKGFVYMETIID